MNMRLNCTTHINDCTLRSNFISDVHTVSGMDTTLCLDTEACDYRNVERRFTSFDLAVKFANCEYIDSATLTQFYIFDGHVCFDRENGFVLVGTNLGDMRVDFTINSREAWANNNPDCQSSIAWEVDEFIALLCDSEDVAGDVDINPRWVNINKVKGLIDAIEEYIASSYEEHLASCGEY